MSQDICTRFARYLYSTLCSWIVKTGLIEEMKTKILLHNLYQTKIDWDSLGLMHAFSRQIKAKLYPKLNSFLQSACIDVKCGEHQICVADKRGPCLTNTDRDGNSIECPQHQCGKKFCYFHDKYMLIAGWEVRMVKNCDRGLENTARGRRPRAAFSRPRSQFFIIRTDP